MEMAARLERVAMIMLFSTGISQASSVKSSAYHPRDSPWGGKYSAFFAFSDTPPTTTMGLSRKISTRARNTCRKALFMGRPALSVSRPSS